MLLVNLGSQRVHGPQANPSGKGSAIPRMWDPEQIILQNLTLLSQHNPSKMELKETSGYLWKGKNTTKEWEESMEDRCEAVWPA